MTTAIKKMTRKEYRDRQDALSKGFTEIKALATSTNANADRENRVHPSEVFGLSKATKDGHFKSFGHFAALVKAAGVPGARADERLQNWMQKTPSGLNEASGTDGGVLVPPEYSQKVFERVYEDSDLLKRTDQYTVSGNSISFPRNNETSRATGSRWGGVRGYWKPEAGQLTASKPGLGRFDMRLHKLTVLAYMTDELMSDSSAMEQYLGRVCAQEIDFLVSDAIIRGDGVGMPLGILNAGCKIAVAKETGQGAATIVHANIIKMMARLFAKSRANAVWYINQDIEPQLNQMTLSSGVVIPSYLPPGGLSAAPYGTLLGKPVLPIEQCDTLGTEGDIILADPSQYCTISKGALETAMSIHLRFDYDETAFRFIFRLDGQPWWPTVMTPYKGSATQAPFITLAVRA